MDLVKKALGEHGGEVVEIGLQGRQVLQALRRSNRSRTAARASAMTARETPEGSGWSNQEAGTAWKSSRSDSNQRAVAAEG